MRLAAGDLEATVEGGDLLSVGSLRDRGDELLLAPGALPEAYRVHGRRAGITLLHPWANRLGADSYTVGGVTACVPAGDPAITRDPAGLAIHGLAPPGAWAVSAPPRPGAGPVCNAAATFGGHPAFPFPHAVRVRFTLTGSGLTVTAEIRPTTSRPVPVSFGWHPYMRPPGAARASWVLELPPRRRLSSSRAGLPDGGGTHEPAEIASLGKRTFDDCYDELPAGAVLAVRAGGRRVSVALLEGFRAAQVFAPADVDVISLEPMTAPTDALRSGLGLRTVAPGQVARAAFAVRVERASGAAGP